MMEANVLESALQIFPNEIWLQIVSKIGSHDELIKLRSVSKDIKIVADEVLKMDSSMWKPTFDSDFRSFVDGVKGTRLTTVGEIIKFLDDIEDSAWNPFPNGTLIFFPKQYEKCLADGDEDDKLMPKKMQAVNAFYDGFTNLVESYKEEITSLVFCFKNDSDDDEISTQLESILKLKNLKNLAVLRASDRLKVDELDGYLADDQEDKNSWLQTRSLVPKLKVKELLIFGRSSENDVLIGVPSCIRALCAAVSESCQRLQFCTVDGSALATNQSGQVQPLVSFPNLKRLKLMGTLSREFEDHLFVNGLIPPNLEEFSFKYLNYWSDEDLQVLSGAFRNVLEKANRHQKTLKLFHINLGDDLLFNEVMNMEEDDGQLHFPKTTHLILNYTTFENWNNSDSYINAKFPNLKELTILDEYDEDIGLYELHKFVKELFTKMPSLEVIYVPRYLWIAKRDGSVSLDFCRFASN